MAERRRATPCLRRQLERLRSAVLANGPVNVRVPVYIDALDARVYIHPTRAWYASTWDSVVADNIPAHMSASNRELYRGLFDQMRRLEVLNTEEGVAAADLIPLHDELRLEPATRIELLRVIARERARVDLMYLLARQTQTMLRKTGRRYDMPTRDYADLNTERWCRANGLFTAK